MRVLHGPVNIGNHAWDLSRAERRLGLDSSLVTTQPSSFAYPTDRQLVTPGEAPLKGFLRRLVFGYRAPFRYDLLHFYFGRSLLSLEDLPDLDRAAFDEVRLARRLGHATIMTLQGCDIRQAGPSHANAEARGRSTACAPDACGLFEACLTTHDARRQDLARTVLPLFDRVFVLNPDLLRFAPGAEFAPYAIDASAAPVRPPRLSGPVRIVHAPSDRGIKGTELIVRAIQALKARHEIELVLVEGLEHAEALRRYDEADLVIDQVRVGWYGGLAVETMARGKPTLCYIDPDNLDVIPPAMRAELPVLSVDPRRLEADIEAVLRARADWPAISARSARFARRWHGPDVVAAAMARVYADRAAPFDMTPFLPDLRELDDTDWAASGPVAA